MRSARPAVTDTAPVRQKRQRCGDEEHAALQRDVEELRDQRLLPVQEPRTDLEVGIEIDAERCQRRGEHNQ